jgi:antitoxin (DNA-binding transcriptional repressor) of toxin-antitoxin stability system
MIILFYKGETMKLDISATDAVRHFSELLNNIKYRGNCYRIIRGGKPAAALVPLDEAGSSRLMSDLNDIFQTLPRLDPDDTNFADDVLEAIQAQPPLPGDTSWE